MEVSLTEDAKKYIESWEKYCPDYKICRWDESTFDINEIPYVKEAYEAKNGHLLPIMSGYMY